MDRSTTSASECSAAVQTTRRASLDLLSPAAAGERGESASAPAPRRAVPGLPVFRQPSHGRHAGGQPQTHSAADADSGHRSALPETELEPPGSRSRDLPVPASRHLHRTAQPSLEHRYYIHTDAWRLPLPGCRDGLVQPFRAQLGTFQYDGDRLLSGRTGGGVPLRPARNLELRSRLSVHLTRLSGAAKKARHLYQHGRTGPCPGQRFHRAPVAQSEVRTHLPRRFRQRGRSVPSAGPLLPFLQSTAPTPGARLPHAGRSVPAPVHKEKVIAMMVGSAPQTPRDLTLFFSRMDVFCFSGWRSCRTLERLDRKTGQRRDATRAPIQARNGWRPSGRLLVTPPHHLSDGQILSNLWGPPQAYTEALPLTLFCQLCSASIFIALLSRSTASRIL